MRRLMAALALLAAGAVGLMTATAQPGAAAAKMSELKKAELLQKEFNQVIDGLVKLGRLPPGGANRRGKFVIDTTVLRDFFTNRVVQLKGKGVTVDEVVKVQKEVNRRFDAIRKAGKLTELDRKFLTELPRLDLRKLISTGTGCGVGVCRDSCSRMFVDRKKGG